VFQSAAEAQAALEPLMRAIAAAAGPRCEVVLHDLSAPSPNLGRTIIAIENGHVSGRKVGGPSTNLGFEVVADQDKEHDSFGYRGFTHDGRELRSSSIYFRDRGGRIVAALCVNCDISSIKMVKALIASLEPDMVSGETETESIETVGPDIDNVVDSMISRAIAETGRPVAAMSRADKINVVRTLRSKGVTEVTNSMSLIARRLGVSRSTAYQYLDESRRAV
jgi:predicted transcriptional regulator YheO